MAGRRRIRIWLKRLAIGAGAVVMLLVLAVSVFWATLPPPVPKADYAQLMVDIAARGQPPESEAPNGWPALVEFGRQADEFADRVVELQKARLAAEPGGASPDEPGYWGFDALTEPGQPAWSREPAKQVYDEMIEGGFFERLPEITKTRRFVLTKPHGAGSLEWFSDWMDEFGGIRRASSVFALRMQLAAREGDYESAVLAFDAGLAAAGALANHPSIISHLTASSVLQRMIDQAEHCLDEQIDNGRLIESIASAFDRRLPLPLSAKAFEGERIMCRDYFRPWNDSWQAKTEADLQSRLFVHLHDPLYADAIRAAGMSRAARTKAGLTDEHFAMLGRPGWRFKLVVGDMYEEASNYGTIVGKVLGNSDSVDVRAKGLRLRLALELHRLRRGAYPESLDALVPEFIAALPVDTFAPDGRFGYRRIDTSADGSGRGYILYSVGHDGVDDGGTPPSDEHAMSDPTFGALLGKCVGCDYIFNSPPKQTAASEQP